MEAIVAFLTARYDEEELMALAAIDDDSGQDGGFEDAYEDLIRPPSGVGIAQGGFGEAAARMIVWNTPRRVLADVAAKRAIVRLYEGSGLRITMGQVLRALAQPYAEHPDFDPTWRV